MPKPLVPRMVRATQTGICMAMADVHDAAWIPDDPPNREERCLMRVDFWQAFRIFKLLPKPICSQRRGQGAGRGSPNDSPHPSSSSSP